LAGTGAGVLKIKRYRSGFFKDKKDLKCWQAARRFGKGSIFSFRHGKLSKNFETRSQFKQAEEV
jgi:hypothetical protein